MVGTTWYYVDTPWYYVDTVDAALSLPLSLPLKEPWKIRVSESVYPGHSTTASQDGLRRAMSGCPVRFVQKHGKLKSDSRRLDRHRLVIFTYNQTCAIWCVLLNFHSLANFKIKPVYDIVRLHLVMFFMILRSDRDRVLWILTAAMRWVIFHSCRATYVFSS